MKKHIVQILLAVFTVTLLSVSVLVGCGSSPSGNTLEGTTWKTTSITDAKGVPYTKYLDYEMTFTEENINFNPGLDIEGYVSGAGQSFRYTFEDGTLSISQGVGDMPTVVKCEDNVIEIRSPQGVLFHYEKQ